MTPAKSPNAYCSQRHPHTATEHRYQSCALVFLMTRWGSAGTLTSSRPFAVVPVISGITPISGPVGALATITGTGFEGATKIGGVKAATYTVSSGTQIVATVPAGAKTGKIAVTTLGGTASSKALFTVTP